VKVVIVKEPEPYSKTGVAFRARREDGTSLYMGEETREALVKRLHENFKDLEITDAEP